MLESLSRTQRYKDVSVLVRYFINFISLSMTEIINKENNIAKITNACVNIFIYYAT